MISLIAAVALVPLVYDFPKEKPLEYLVRVSFDGFLPVFGGQDGTAEITLGLTVLGLSPDDKSNPRLASELTTAKVKFMGESLPFTVDNVKAYFPRTTLAFSPQGKTVKTDAPDVQLPIRLPGLDVKRFPDLTYLPLEFPVDGVEMGKPWSFTKRLGGADATYTVTPTEISDELAKFKVEVDQTDTTLENEALELVKKDSDAKYQVVTVLKGFGTVIFDRRRSAAKTVRVDVQANGVQTDLKTKATTNRKLMTKLEVDLKDKA